jgi:holo-[acyl-carrier protein] synthase
VRESLRRWDGRLVAKLMDAEEASRLPAEQDARADAVAAAIALKEAASKALGTGWSHGVRWRDVVVLDLAPARVRLLAGAARVAAHRGAADSTAWLEIRGDLIVAEVWLSR